MALLRGTNEIWIYDPSQNLPVARRLAGSHDDVVFLRPFRPARRLLDAHAWVRAFGWSPDGTWLFVLASDASPTNVDVLMALPAAGGEPETLSAGIDMWPVSWARDGHLYYASEQRWHRLDPPARWRPRHAPAGPGPRFAEVGPDLTLRFRPFAEGAEGEPDLLGPAFDSQPSFKVFDTLPNGSRSLVGLTADTAWAHRLVDVEGRTRLDLSRAGIRFQPTAITADRRWIIGFSGDWEGETWTHTWLEVADTGGLWRVRIPETAGGSHPQMSRQGSFIAFRKDQGTWVGRLTVEGPNRKAVIERGRR